MQWWRYGAFHLRRRKRSWGASWAYLLPVLVICGTFWIVPALFSTYRSFFDRAMASPQKVLVALDEAAEAANRLLRGWS
jgi:ABC-type sugar transport system permease subunit